MNKKKLFKNCIVLMWFTVLLIVFCYFFVDRQVAFWVFHHHTAAFKIFYYFSKIPEIFIALVPFLYLYLIVKFSFDEFSSLDNKFLIFSNTLAITQFLKELSKYIFGRYWPQTWENNNPSLIHDHLYGFHFFHHGVQYQSFPSGHAATLVASITILWLFYPRLWWLYSLIMVVSMIGTLAMNSHFVSDIIAGGLLGFLIAVYATKIKVVASKSLQ